MSRSSVSIDGSRVPLLVLACVCLGLRDIWSLSLSPEVEGCGSAVTDGCLAAMLVLVCSSEPLSVDSGVADLSSAGGALMFLNYKEKKTQKRQKLIYIIVKILH